MNFAKHLLTLGLVASAIGLASASCSISKPECTVGQTSTPQIGLNFAGLSAFSVRYILKDGSGECANFKREVVGFQSYHPKTGTDTEPVRDFTKTMVAVRTQSLGELAWMTEDLGVAGDVVEPNAVGEFSAVDPSADDLCEVKAFSPAQVVFPATVFDSDPANYAFVDDMLPEECMADGDCNANFNYVCAGADPATMTPGACSLPSECATDDDCNGVAGGACRIVAADPGYCVVPINLPATDLKYEWTNVNFYVTAAATGTQFSANVKITLNGCVANYTAVGMWPAIPCSEFPYADPELGAVGCGVDADCKDAAYPSCDANAEVCVRKCTGDGDCSGLTPKCDMDGGYCVSCLVDSDCKKADFNACVGATCSHIVTGQELCDPEANAALGRPSGSGINPDFGPVVCDTEPAVVPLVDTWYSIPDVGGVPLSEPRCMLNTDKIPALGGSTSTSTASQ